MTTQLVPVDDGSPAAGAAWAERFGRRQGDTPPAWTEVRAGRTKYRISVLQTDGTELALAVGANEAVVRARWGERKGELAVRMDLEQVQASPELFPMMGRFRMLVDTDGSGWREVWHGVTVERYERYDGLSITAYDPLWFLMQSHDNRYYPVGVTATRILKDLAGLYSLPLVEGISGPSTELESQLFAGDSLADMVLAALAETYRRGGGEWHARYRPDAAASLTAPGQPGPVEVAGGIEVVQPGMTPAPSYRITAANTTAASDGESIAKLRTRVKVFVQGFDLEAGDEAAHVEDGLVEFGILQDVVVVGEDEDTILAAKMRLNEVGRPERIRELTLPDVPFMRRWDPVVVEVGRIQGSRVVESIMHDAAAGTMTIGLKDEAKLLFPDAWLPPQKEIPPRDDEDPDERPDNPTEKGLYWPYPGSEGSGWWQSGYGFDPSGSSGHVHNGIDINASDGASVRAANGGKVVYVWNQAPASEDSTGYGNWVKIDHGNGFESRYAHLYSGGVYVTTGQQVAAGETIGRQDNTGRSSGSHLHFEVWYNGSPVNPRSYCEEWSA